jgi:simple sugar transport system substrate-binding protein
MKEADPNFDETIETLNMKDGPTRRLLLRNTGLVSATAAASALLAACSSNANNAKAAASAAGNFPKTPAWKFWFVNHVTTNPFFVPTQYGFQDAAALLGLPTPNWGGSQNSIAADMVNYTNTAIASNAAGIAIAVIDSSAFTGPIANAMNKGIPVVSYNADGTYVNGKPDIGSNRLCYVGQALYLSGQSMGAQIKSLIPGGGDIAIFIATPGTGNIQPRYDGAVSMLDSSYTVHEVATGAPTAGELNAEKAYLLAHGTGLKGAFAVDYGSTSFLGAALASTGLTGKVASGGFDTAPQTLSALQAGTMDFTIYQDPYLQGFLPVLYMYLYNLSDAQLPPPDTDTGLSVIDKQHVGQFVKNSRFQGGSSAQKYLARPSGPIVNLPATTST